MRSRVERGLSGVETLAEDVSDWSAVDVPGEQSKEG